MELKVLLVKRLLIIRRIALRFRTDDQLVGLLINHFVRLLNVKLVSRTLGLLEFLGLVKHAVVVQSLLSACLRAIITSVGVSWLFV